VTTVMVVIMAVCASVFFLMADQVFSKLIGFLLTVGH